MADQQCLWMWMMTNLLLPILHVKEHLVGVFTHDAIFHVVPKPFQSMGVGCVLNQENVHCAMSHWSFACFQIKDVSFRMI